MVCRVVETRVCSIESRASANSKVVTTNYQDYPIRAQLDQRCPSYTLQLESKKLGFLFLTLFTQMNNKTQKSNYTHLEDRCMEQKLYTDLLISIKQYKTEENQQQKQRRYRKTNLSIYQMRW